jgi:hypothetical protein
MDIFTHPGYYENVLFVNRMFSKDMPEIIIDPRGLMKEYFFRIPELEKHYTPTAEGYALKKLSN